LKLMWAVNLTASLHKLSSAQSREWVKSKASLRKYLKI
jgi:hypothetical protein